MIDYGSMPGYHYTDETLLTRWYDYIICTSYLVTHNILLSYMTYIVNPYCLLSFRTFLVSPIILISCLSYPFSALPLLISC